MSQRVTASSFNTFIYRTPAGALSNLMEIVDQPHKLSGLYCLAHPDLPDDRSKIIFMLTNLSGDTTKWAQLLNQRVLNKSDPDLTPRI
ncbi:hypothetical protein VP01_4468g2 [Puccinia sorghi]|uniref:Uncharacterized protein n=1 Tax=Puccinia sorghi TaxID=27349 RepID=A0A0L6URC0_9BASI|nr:hypothetical protein VP01_4468g2 [Puccinia sorghi]